MNPGTGAPHSPAGDARRVFIAAGDALRRLRLSEACCRLPDTGAVNPCGQARELNSVDESRPSGLRRVWQIELVSQVSLKHGRAPWSKLLLTSKGRAEELGEQPPKTRNMYRLAC